MGRRLDNACDYARLVVSAGCPRLCDRTQSLHPIKRSLMRNLTCQRSRGRWNLWLEFVRRLRVSYVLYYAKKIAREVHRSLHFDLVYVWRKGVPPKPYTPNRRPSFQTEMLLLNEDGKFGDSTPV